MEITKDILTFFAASAALSIALFVISTILACINYLIGYTL